MRVIPLPILTLATALSASAQTPVQPYPFAPPPGPQTYPHPLTDTNEGFQPIFDGTLKNWDGDPQYWRVENNVLIGEVTSANLLKQNSFLIWRGGTPKDFELKAEFRISDHGNSGINYRSVEISGTKWLIRGYQADIDGADKYTGQNYEERGRTFLAMRGPGHPRRRRPDPPSSQTSGLPTNSKPSSTPTTGTNTISSSVAMSSSTSSTATSCPRSSMTTPPTASSRASSESRFT